MKKLILVTVFILSISTFANINNLHKKALNLYKNNKLKAAINIYENKGLENILKEADIEDISDKKLAGILNDYAFFLIKDQQFHKAKPVLDKVIELDNKRSVAYYNLAEIYDKENNEQLAKENLLIYSYLRGLNSYLKFDTKKEKFVIKKKLPKLLNKYLEISDLENIYINNFQYFKSDKTFTEFINTKVFKDKISWNDAEKRNNIIYEKGEKIPFTGRRIKKYNNGEISINAEYKNGKRNGQYISYHLDGHIYINCNYKNGEKYGDYISYFPNGQLKMKGFFIKGTSYGKFIEYYENGNLKQEVHNTGSFKFYFRDGTLNISGQYKNFIPIGEWSRYNYKGILFEKGSYENGKQIGVWIEAVYEEGINGGYKEVYYPGKNNTDDIFRLMEGDPIHYQFNKDGTSYSIYDDYDLIDTVDLTKQKKIPLDEFIRNYNKK